MRKQPIGEAVQENLRNAGSWRWEPEKEIAASQAHLHLVKSVAGSRRVRFFETRIHDVASGGLGTVQVAIDEIAGEACGILLTAQITGIDAETHEPIFADEATTPIRFPCLSEAAKAVAAFCNQLSATGAFREHLADQSAAEMQTRRTQR
jgi:hypothetical protein